MTPSLYSYDITPVFSKLAITLPDLAFSSVRGRSAMAGLSRPSSFGKCDVKTHEEVAASSLADHTDRPTGLELWGWVGREPLRASAVLAKVLLHPLVVLKSEQAPPLRVGAPRPSARACLEYSGSLN